MGKIEDFFTLRKSGLGRILPDFAVGHREPGHILKTGSFNSGITQNRVRGSFGFFSVLLLIYLNFVSKVLS